MGCGVTGMDGQYSWIHSIQNFTSSLTYLTEVRKNNCNLIMMDGNGRIIFKFDSL